MLRTLDLMAKYLLTGASKKCGSPEIKKGRNKDPCFSVPVRGMPYDVSGVYQEARYPDYCNALSEAVLFPIFHFPSLEFLPSE